MAEKFFTKEALEIIENATEKDILIATAPEGATGADTEEAIMGIQPLQKKIGFGLMVLPPGWKSYGIELKRKEKLKG